MSEVLSGAADRPVVVAAGDPEAAGVSQGGDLSFDAPPLAPVPASATLAEVSRDRVLFTHAALLTHAGFRRDPLSAFVAETKLSAPLTIVRTQLPLFRGLASRDASGAVLSDDFNYHLWAIAKADFKALYQFFGQLAAVDRDSKTFIATLTQAVPVVDVPAVTRLSVAQTKAPLVEVFCVGLQTSRGRVHFSPPKEPSVRTPVRVVVDGKVDDRLLVMAKALFDPREDGSAVAASVEQPVAGPSPFRPVVVENPTVLIGSGGSDV